jgi:hypothetical protein
MSVQQSDNPLSGQVSQISASAPEVSKSRKQKAKYAIGLKLVLLGIITVAVPIIFIIQDIQLEKEKKENANNKAKVQGLDAKLQYSQKIIDLMAVKAIVHDTVYKAVSDTIDIHKVVWNERNQELIYIGGSQKIGNNLDFVEYYLVPIDTNILKLLFKYKMGYLTKHSIHQASRLPVKLPLDNPISKLLSY